MLFKVIIRVCKSLNEPGSGFGFFNTVDVLREPIIESESKEGVKKIISEKYPQFFQNGKVFEKETKDVAQFFYVLIYPLSNWEMSLIDEGEWECASCGQIHENKYLSKPVKNKQLFGDDVLFCKSDDDYCMKKYEKEKFSCADVPDNTFYIKKDSPNYIYKITEKATGKCYVGKTRNEPVFRWWDHLRRNHTEFGKYLRSTSISEWTFEVVEVLPSSTPDSEVFRVESEYMLKYNSISGGFNSTISNKHATISIGLFDQKEK